MTHFTEKTEEAILQIVEPIMDNCLDCSNTGNHAKHVRDFTDRLKAIVTPENLASQLKYRPHGVFTRREFVCLFRRRESIGVVWRQFVSSTDDELVNHAIFVERDGQICIEHCLIC